MFALDDKMSTVVSDVVDPITGKVLSPGNVRLRGITGTGVIGLVSTGLETGLMRPGQINAKQTALRLQDDVVFDQEDLIEVGKTISAFVAGHMTLAAESGISLKDIRTMFMSGASGTYMSPHKAARIGLIPGAVRRTVQAGNTSLALAREIVRFPGILDELQEVADSLRARHIMFAGSKVFENAFAVEMGIWCEGMPQSLEAKMLKQFGLEPRPTPSGEIHSVKLSKCDIQDVGENGLKVVGDIGVQLSGEPEGCLGDARCVKACNEEAIRLDRIGDRWRITISSDKCMGTACRRCEEACRMRILKIEKFRITKSDDLDVITRSAS
jgi:methylamine methyltransferase corrinoid protein reductive activase